MADRDSAQQRVAEALRRADYMNWSAAEVAEKIDGTIDALCREARADAERPLRELALIFLRNWHLVARPDHPHDLVDDCDEPLFVRMKVLLAAPPAPAPAEEETEG